MTTTVHEVPDLVTTSVETGDYGLIHIRQVWAAHEAGGVAIPERIETITLFPAESESVARALLDAIGAETGTAAR